MLNPKIKTLLIVIVTLSVVIGLVAGAVVLTSPEHISGNPTPTATPSPTPTPSSSPTPTPTTVKASAIHLTSNLTTPFYVGSTIRLTAQLNQPTAGVVVTLRNINIDGDNIVDTATTNTLGVAMFDRKPTVAFEYYVTAVIE